MVGNNRAGNEGDEPRATVNRLSTEGHRQLLALTASGSEIGRRVGVSKQAVSLWRGGQRVPDHDARAALAREFGIPSRAWDERAAEASPMRQEGPPRAEQGEAAEPSDRPVTGALGATLGDLEVLIEQLKQALADDRLAPVVRASLSGRLTAALELRSRLQGDSRTDEAKLAQSPAWARLEAAMASALAPYPQAAEAVAKAFDALGWKP